MSRFGTDPWKTLCTFVGTTHGSIDSVEIQPGYHGEDGPHTKHDALGEPITAHPIVQPDREVILSTH